MMMKSIETFLLFLLGLVKVIVTIVNPNNETARMVIYLQKPNDLGPRSWLAGINCLDRFTNIYFKKRETLTRSPNIVLSSFTNMSTPTAQIQEGYLKLMMEAISAQPPKKINYQLRIVGDSKIYLRNPMSQRELLLADFYIIITDSITRLKNIMRGYMSRMLSWNPGARFLIVYNNVDNRNNEISTARKIFEELLFNFYVHRVALMYATSSTKYSLLLMDYFNSTACRQLKVKAIATCEEGHFTPNNDILLELQIRKFLSSITLSNCTFYMCAGISAPFVESDCVYGMELRIIGFIKNRLKFGIKQSCTNDNRGVEQEPGNWTGLLGRLNEKSCDFIMGGFYPDNDVIQNFWVSDTYLEDSYTWFVKLADERPPWMALYAIFQHFTWLSCVLMLLFTWLSWYTLVNLLPEPFASREFSLVGINNMAVTICVSVNERPICGASRIFFVLLALYGLTLTSTYTSKLIAVFSNPGYLHQIHSFEEVKEKDIPYGGYEENRDWFENEEDMWIFNDYNDTEDFIPSSDNIKYIMLGKRVLLSSRMFILQNPLSDSIYAFPYNVFSSPMQMIMKPGFPFLYEFNWMIRYMRDFGIISKIQKDFIYRNTYLNRIAKMRPEFHETEIVLTPEHLQGSFSILIFGALISTTLFFGELVTFYVIKPCRNYCKGTTTSMRERTVEQKLVNKTKKRSKKKSKDKLKKTKAKEKSIDDAITITWSDHRDLEVVPIQKGIRFTPLKRRIIETVGIERKASASTDLYKSSV